jgi:ribosome maturation factor RimP
MIDIETVKNLVEERMAERNKGLFIVELTISSTNVINIEIDSSEGGVSVEDCMSVSRNVEHNLDREEEDFELHVSSAGLDKALRHPLQYQKNIGRELSVVKTNGEKLQGLLVGVKEEELALTFEKKIKNEKNKNVLVIESVSIPKSDIKEAKVVVSFKG